MEICRASERATARSNCHGVFNAHLEEREERREGRASRTWVERVFNDAEAEAETNGSYIWRLAGRPAITRLYGNVSKAENLREDFISLSKVSNRACA